MAVIVSGTPGTGKSTFAKSLAKKENLRYIDVNELIEEKKLYEEFDKKRLSKVVDIKKLNEVLIGIIKKNSDVVIDSHLSHYLPKKYVEVCFITKCSLPELKKRLKIRGYSKQKIRENLDAEIFDTCRIEALEAGHSVEVVMTDE